MPLIEQEPTPEQLSALFDKVVGRGEEPYADFSVLTPFGRRCAKALRCRSWLLQPDGSYIAHEIPGPPSLAAWEACWKVFRSTLLMLEYPGDGVQTFSPTPVVNLACMEEYSEHFKAIANEYPETWFMCVVAEDRCRGEQFARLKREFARNHRLGNRNRFDIEYDPRRPWVAVFCAAARDEQYWDREIRRPALSFLARGSTSAMPTVSPSAAAAVSNILGKVNPQGGKGNAGNGNPGPAKKTKAQKRHDRESRLLAETAGAGPGAGKTGKAGGKDKGGGPPYRKFEGREICFKFAKGGRGACRDTCPHGRAHVCQWCLQPHANAESDRNPGAKGRGKQK